MPVLDSERASMPRSALRYRPVQANQARPGQTITRRRTSFTPVLPDVEEDGFEDVPPPAPHQKRAPSRRVRKRHPLFWLGFGLLLLLVLGIGVSQLVTWGTNRINDWKYGYPRVFQMDAVLGHQDSTQHPTHLLALNLNGEIILEEFPGGDASKARSSLLTSVVGNGSDLLPVTLRLLQRQGRPGQPDLIVEVGDVVSLLVNDQGKFRPPTSAERRQLLLLLQS